MPESEFWMAAFAPHLLDANVLILAKSHVHQVVLCYVFSKSYLQFLSRILKTKYDLKSVVKAPMETKVVYLPTEHNSILYFFADGSGHMYLFFLMR